MARATNEERTGSDKDANGNKIDWSQVQENVRKQSHEDRNHGQETTSYAPGAAPVTHTSPAGAPVKGAVTPQETIFRGPEQTIDWSSLWNRVDEINATDATPGFEIANTPSYKELIKGRASAFEVRLWQTSPYLWAQIITSRYREKLIDQLAEHVPNMDAWIRTQNTFAGVSGGLVHLRVQALNINDPQVRLQALNDIDNLAKLPVEQQQAVLAWAQHGEGNAENAAVMNKPITGLSGENMGPGGAVVTREQETETESIGPGLQALLGAQYAGYSGGQVNIHSHVGQAATSALPALQQKALQKLFPGTKEQRPLKVYAPAQFDKDAAQAVGEWNSKVGGTIMVMVNSASKADIVLKNGGVNATERGAGMPDELIADANHIGTTPGGAPHIINIPRAQGEGGDLRLTGASPTDVPTQVYQSQTIAHELGHALGLEHPEQVVNPNGTYQLDGVMGGAPRPDRAEGEAVAAKWGLNYDDNPGMFDTFGRIVSPQDLYQSVAKANGIEEMYQSVFLRDDMDTPLGASKAAFNALTAPLAAAPGVGHVLSAVARSRVGKDLRVPSIMADVSGAEARASERLMNGATRDLGNWADNAWFAAPGTDTHLSEDTQNFVGNLALVFLLHEAGEVAGTAKTTLGGSAEFVQGEVGFQGGSYGGLLRQAIHEPGVTLTHLPSTIIDPLTQQATFSAIQAFYGTSAADWVNRGAATSMFKYIDNTVEEIGPEKAAGAIAQRYPRLAESGVLPDLIRVKSWEEMPQATLDYLNHVSQKDIAGRLADNTAALRDVNARLAETVAPPAANIAKNAEELNGILDAKTVELEKPGGGFRQPGEDVQVNPSAYLSERSAGRMTVDLKKSQENGSAVEHGNNIWSYKTAMGDQIYVRVDDSGNVVSSRLVAFNNPVVAETTEAAARQGHGSALLDQHWKDAGVNSIHDLDKIKELLNANDYSESGIELNKSKIRRLAAEGGEATPDPALLAELQDELTNLQADRITLRRQADEAYTKQAPFYEFPSRRTLPDYLHRVFYRPNTIVERILRDILNPLRGVKEVVNWSSKRAFGDWESNLNPEKQAYLSKLFDKIGNEDKMRAPHLASDPGERAFINDGNTTYANRVMQRFGVSEEDRAAMLGKLLNAPDAQRFWEIVTQDFYGKEGLLSKYVPKRTPKAWSDSFLGRYDVNTVNMRGSITLEDGTREPLIPGDTRMNRVQSLPGSPEEFTGYVPLPSAAEFDRILSGYERSAYNLRHASKFTTLANAAATAMDWGTFVMRSGTSLLKPLALLANLPAIILTKMIDESLGNIASPNMRGVMHAGYQADSLVGRPDPSLLGNALSSGWNMEDNTTPMYAPVNTRDIVQNGLETDKASMVFATRAEQLNSLANSYFYSQFARDGFDVEKFKGRLEGGDPVLTKHYDNNLKVSLERARDGAGMTLDEYLPRVQQYLEESTFHHPEYMDYVKNGRMSPGGALAGREWHGDVEASQAEKWMSLQSQASDIRAALSNLDPHLDRADIRAHQAQLADVIEQLDDTASKLEEFGGSAEDKVAIIDQSHPQALANDIKNRFSRNEITLPDETTVSANARFNVTGSSMLEMMDQNISNFSKWMYGRDGRWAFRTIGKLEGRYARGSFYEQRALQFAKGFENAGMSTEDALAFGRLRAGIQAKDLFYDLTARSTTERALRNLFWFAPVNGELLYRWLYAIPAQSGGWIPGLAITAARVAAWHNVLTDAGIIHKDKYTGQEVFPVSGLGKAIETLTAGKLKIPDTLEIPVASLNPHLSSPLPQLAPLPAFALSTAANTKYGKYAPVLKDLANLVAPHSYATFVPSSIRNAMAVLGVKVPDPLAPGYVNQTWDRTHDIAYQYAYHEMTKEGDVAPDITKFDVLNKDTTVATAANDEYMAQWNPWFDRLNALANSYSKGLYAVSTLSSAVLPGYIVPTDEDRQKYAQWWEKKIQPQIDLDNGSMSQQTRTNMNRWLTAHPQSIAYSISYGYYTGKDWTPDIAKTDSDYYSQLYLHGVKGTMSPDNYSKTIAALGSKVYFDAKLQANLNRIAPDGKASTMLKNWGDRTRAIADDQIAWQNYLFAHKQDGTSAILDQADEAMRAHYGLPTQTIEQQYVKTTLLGLTALAKAFAGTDKLPISEYRTTVSKLKQLNSQLYVDTGGELTPMEKGISWYFDNVMTPYFDATQHLYEKKDQLEAAGLPVTDIYRRIDRIKAQYDSPTYEGEKYPSIDEFFYGTQSPTQQNYTRTGYITKPISWLSRWERQKAGYGSFKGEDKMWNDLAALDDQTANFIANNDISSSSNWYDSVKTWQANQGAAIAKQYGQAGMAAYKLETSNPYVRLRESGYGADNASMQEVYKMVSYTRNALLHDGDSQTSPDGYSQYAIALKRWVYDYVAQQENQDPQFRDLMQGLSFSSSPQQGNTNHPTGVPLWEAIFYGNYNPDFISSDLIDSAPRGPNII